MESSSIIFKIFQGDAFSEDFISGSAVHNPDTCKDDYLADDLSSFTGKGQILDSEGVMVLEVDLDLTFTDAESTNITFTLTSEQTGNLAVGCYSLEFKIIQPVQPIYMPDEGSMTILINAAR